MHRTDAGADKWTVEPDGGGSASWCQLREDESPQSHLFNFDDAPECWHIRTHTYTNIFKAAYVVTCSWMYSPKARKKSHLSLRSWNCFKNDWGVLSFLCRWQFHCNHVSVFNIFLPFSCVQVLSFMKNLCLLQVKCQESGMRLVW